MRKFMALMMAAALVVVPLTGCTQDASADEPAAVESTEESTEATEEESTEATEEESTEATEEESTEATEEAAE